MIVQDLWPGMEIVLPLPDITAIVADHPRQHPLDRFPQNLVTWRLSDGSWSHDSLHHKQEVGELVSNDPVQWRRNLEWVYNRRQDR